MFSNLASPNQAAPRDDANTSAILKVAALDTGLQAIINASENGLNHIYLENTGSLVMSRVQVLGNGKPLGIISQLNPGEKKILALNGPIRNVSVKGIGPSGQQIDGNVQLTHTPATISVSSPTLPEDPKLDTKSAPGFSAGSSIPFVEVTMEMPPQNLVLPKVKKHSPLSLDIAANRTDGREGDVAAFRCTAVNLGPEELSDVRIICAGKIASTKFLPPGKALQLEGSIVIHNSTSLLAGVQGKDAKDNVFVNNSTLQIWRISPQIKLLADGPIPVHRGENALLSLKIENEGKGNLTNITAFDSFGDFGRIPMLGPGDASILQKERTIDKSMKNEFQVKALDASGNDVYASVNLDLAVLKSGLEIEGQPSEVRFYQGQSAEVSWILRNTGEETLRNITLGADGNRCMLKVLPPGKSMRMAGIYKRDKTTWLNVTAQGYDSGGYASVANGSVLLRPLKPGLSLKIMPSQMEVCPGEIAEISCLITNVGDDPLTDILLSQNRSALASIDALAPGEFRLIDSRTVIPSNSTLQFLAEGKDSSGRTWSDEACASVKTVIASLKIFSSVSPSTVVLGGSANLTCTVANTGSVPLYSIFVISKKFGPLGTIDFLPPKRQKTISAGKVVTQEVDDSITAEGFTQDKTSIKSLPCPLRIAVRKTPGQITNGIGPTEVDEASPQMVSAKISRGNLSMPLGLPDEGQTGSQAAKKIAHDVDRAAQRSNNQVLEGISNLLRYVEKLLGTLDQKEEVSLSQPQSPDEAENLSASRNYELSIAAVRGSEHGAIRILDVSASPSRPAAWASVKVSAHIKSKNGIKSATAKWGLADAPLTKQQMQNVNRIWESPLKLESGNAVDGYWSCTIPGKAAGVYMVLSVSLTDGESSAEEGPFMLHWSTVNSLPEAEQRKTFSTPSTDTMLFIESSSVKGQGEVSIKDTFNGPTMRFDEKMKGNGSISLESMRCIDKSPMEKFVERKDLVFTNGQLKGRQHVASPNFQGGIGASVTERFNLSHVDKSEESMVSSASPINNTLVFNTDQAFDGTWNIQTQYSKFYKKIKADQQYTGSFQTQKKIKFQDDRQK